MNLSLLKNFRIKVGDCGAEQNFETVARKLAQQQ